MQIVERIKREAAKQGYTLTELEHLLGFGSRSIYKWDKNAPSVEKVMAVANFLRLPLPWLITGKEESLELPKDFIEKYRKLSPADRTRIDHYMDICLCDAQIYGKKTTPNQNKALPILGYATSNISVASPKLLGYIQTKYTADYVLIMDDNSMTPLLSPNEYLYVKQNVKLKNGDIGIFFRNHQTICRQYFEFEDHIVLHSLNTSFVEESYKKPFEAAVKLIGKVLNETFL